MKSFLFLLLVIYPWNSALATLPIYNLVAPLLMNDRNSTETNQYPNELRACQSLTNAKVDFKARPESFLKNLATFQATTKKLCGGNTKPLFCSDRIKLENCYVGFKKQLQEFNQESSSVASRTRTAKASPSGGASAEDRQESPSQRIAR